MPLRYHVVDAFTSRPFGGNPAAVVALDAWLPDETLGAIAAELNLAETAFFVPEADGFRLRWFTPTVEVELCGHATLASAHVLMRVLEPDRTHVRFYSRSGPLEVTRAGGGATLDFPARPPVAIDEPSLTEAVGAALGAEPRALLRASNLVAVFDDEAAVRALAPDFRRVLALPADGVIATAPGGGGGPDFVSRYFTPQHGIDEDPVTGSAHCTLGPYWSSRLGKPAMRAHQVSRRGGVLDVEVRGDRVLMTGASVLVARGELLL